jgi:hypothetical protein
MDCRSDDEREINCSSRQHPDSVADNLPGAWPFKAWRRRTTQSRGEEQEMASKQDNRPHDPSYRRIFTHVGIVRQLIERFIDPALTERLDLNNMETTPTDFTAEGLARREGDLLWKIPIIGQDLPLYVFVWLELQSWPDPKMPVRLMSYILLFYEQLLTQKPDYIQHGLPLVLPVVLYNGSKPWSVPLRLEKLYAPEVVMI